MTGHCRQGFTLVELLIVVSLMAILAAIVLPSATPAVSQHLQAAAEMAASDLGYARSLAVSNGSSYRVVIEVNNNLYRIEHSGSNTALDVLPAHPFRAASDTATQHVVDLSKLPTLSQRGVRLDSAATDGGVVITEIEFGPLGSTTETDESLIWFSSGSGGQVRAVAVSVNPVTGLATVRELTGQGTSEVTTPGP